METVAVLLTGTSTCKVMTPGSWLQEDVTSPRTVPTVALTEVRSRVTCGSMRMWR